MSGSQMKSADENTSQSFKLPSVVLMERAAISVRDFILEHFPERVLISICAGTGNNGGDGLALVRLLHEAGYPVAFTVIGDKSKFSPLCSLQYEILSSYGLTDFEKETYEALLSGAVLVDAIFGTGLSRDLDGKYREIIDDLNEFQGAKIALDIPSGLCASTGRVLSAAFKADYTITFAFEKLGHYLLSGREYCGKVICNEIGIGEASLPGDCHCNILEYSDLSAMLPKRPRDSHKGTFGRVLVIAGSKGMVGAAYLSSKAAYLSGCGLVKIFTPEENRIILQGLLPEAMVSSYDDSWGDSIDTKGKLKQEMDWADVIIMGPGLGQRDIAGTIVDFVLKESQVPMVLDADALNILAKNMDRLKSHKAPIVLTPHIGEMKRLLSTDHINDLVEVSREFSCEYNVTLVLKSASTVISSPTGEVFINPFGNPGMSTGGSGDVLSGIIGGLLAGGCKDPSALGVGLHSLSGDMAAEEIGEASLIAGDLLKFLPKVIKSLEEF